MVVFLGRCRAHYYMLSAIYLLSANYYLLTVNC